MKKIFAAIFIFTFVGVFGQTVTPSQTYLKQYFASSSETILSAGILGNVVVKNTATGVTSTVTTEVIPRFSAFIHLGGQFHFNFSNGFGIYTGLSLRNTGFINRFSDSVKVKQRVYSVGIPVAIKLGNMGKKSYLAIGAEAEFFFNYKQKTFFGSDRGEKVEKFNEWFSNRTELFNPSVFLELTFGKSNYIRLKYYLNNFLVSNMQNYTINGVTYSFVPEKSQLFAVSIGKVIIPKRTANAKKPAQGTTAVFE